MQSSCDTPTCGHQGKPLKQQRFRQVVIYTAGDGACPAWSVQLKCPGAFLDFSLTTSVNDPSVSVECKADYRHNFCVRGGTDTRTYNQGVPDYIQVGEHQFVEKKVVNNWLALMQTAWYVLLKVLYYDTKPLL